MIAESLFDQWGDLYADCVPNHAKEQRFVCGPVSSRCHSVCGLPDISSRLLDKAAECA